MVLTMRRPRTAAAGAAAVLMLTLTACGGGNLGSQGGEEGAEFPDGPVTVTIGQDPGGSTDLIGRALAEAASDELGVPMPVVNKPGANGALAAKELASAEPDGHNILVTNASLFAITPLAVSEEDVVDINDYEVVTGISQDDYVLVANPSSGMATVQDLVDATEALTFGTTGVGTGSQLSQELLFKQAGIDGSAVPFDGGSPAMTAVLGDQVDVASVQLGEAYQQIQAGTLTPIVTFSKERNEFLPDVPTAIEEGYEVPVSQYRAVVAPKGTPEEVLDTLREAFTAAFENPDYQAFNENGLFTPHEISGEEVVEEWTSSLDTYRSIIEEYGIDLGQAE
jgi:tripartite-type tricarboxylate transporter receptor subunit TctC